MRESAKVFRDTRVLKEYYTIKWYKINKKYKPYPTKLQVKCKNMCQLDPDAAGVTVVIVTFKT